MTLIEMDHIVLCVADLSNTIRFYQRCLGMRPEEELWLKQNQSVGCCHGASVGAPAVPKWRNLRHRRTRLL